MRELNECTAEVFRRSEKRIRERARNRSRVFAVCLPVCLIVTVWSVIIFSGIMPTADTSDLAQYSGEMVENAERDPVYIAVEIQDAGLFPKEHCEKVTDTAAVAEMFRAIHALFADADGSNQFDSMSIPAAEDNANSDLAEPAGIWKDYTITFTTEEGSQAVYHLSGNTLLNVSTHEAVFLSDAQAAGLLAVLGISE